MFRPLKKILLKFLLVLVLFPVTAVAQDLLMREKNAGVNLSFNLAFGTHFKRLGINFHFFYLNEFVQANTELRLYYSFKNLGPKFVNPEVVLSQGIVLGYGPKRELFNPFLSNVSNQTTYLNSFGYSYNVYVNTVRTSQRTGIISFQFNRVSLIAENDLLAKPALDRFRTAAFLLQYQHNNQFQAAVNCSMWTGKMGHKQQSHRAEFYHGCYMDTLDAVYPNTSHGLLSAQVKYNLGYSQIAQLNAGIDAERVRNTVQNKFIHDMPWMPRKWNRAHNCHIPMLDSDNKPYLYEANQKIRKSRLYLNVFGNGNLFY